MRILTTIVLCTVVCSGANAQTAVERLERWADGQNAALNGVRQVTMLERGRHVYEGATGQRRLGMSTRYVLESGNAPPQRDVVEVTIDGEPVDRPDEGRRRRHENPIQASMQRAVDLLLQPARLLPLMQPPDEVETIEFNGTEYVSIRMRAIDPGPGLVRAVWWFDPADGRLVQVRVFVENAEGGALDAFVRYERIEGIDLPVRRRVEGSFPWKRRMRTFTILVDVRADIDDHAIIRR